MFNHKRALEILQLATNNPNAKFREGQEDAIKKIVEGSRLLVIQKTGWGKSFVYFIATKLLRENAKGIVILISPLLILMRNQIEMAKKIGLNAEVINSDNKHEWDNIYHKIYTNNVDILLISPERLANEEFQTHILNYVSDNVSMLVIDEAHCISDWGHDFRPDYQRIKRIISYFPENMRILTTTATANDRVLEDIKKVFDNKLEVIKGDLIRHSLFLQTIKLSSVAERLAWLAQYIPLLPGTGIIYVLTQKDSELVASWLQNCNIKAKPYHAGIKDIRLILEDELKNNKLKVLVATTALGMGYDKPDISFVIHYQMPGSVTTYYQQVGRAGRGLDSAYGILLNGNEDEEIINHFINNAFPNKKTTQAIINAIENSNTGLTIRELESIINVSRSKLEQALKILMLESPAPIIKDNSKHMLTSAPISHNFWEKVERLSNIRHQEVNEMRKYVNLEDGHMQFLINSLNGHTLEYNKPRLSKIPSTINDSLLPLVKKYLSNTHPKIEPRKQFICTLNAYNIKQGNINIYHQIQQGKALSYWNDGNYGTLIKTGKYTDNYFDDILVEASKNLIIRWKIEFDYIVPIPSLRNPDLVPNFAYRLAKELDVLCIEALKANKIKAEQKNMENSVQQLKNLDGVFSIDTSTNLNNKNILLIDDMVDSRWTFTIIGWLLRSHKSGKIYPFALSKVGSSE